MAQAKEPLVSVIIPVHNRKELLPATLQSVLCQSHQHLEVIVVDDHSTDGAADLVRQQFGGRVILLANNGRGPGAARNTGLAAAQGQFIKYFDSDDLLTPSCVEVQLDQLRQQQQPAVMSSYIHARETDQGWQLTEPTVMFHRPVLTDVRKAMVSGLFVAIPGMLLSRGLVEKIGPWREDVLAYEDWDYLWRLAAVSPSLGASPQAAFVYRQHNTQITSAERVAANEQDYVAVFGHHLPAVRQQPGPRWRRVPLEARYAELVARHGAAADACAPEPVPAADKVLFRLAQKWGRARTGTAWQPFHGAIRDPSLAKQILAACTRQAAAGGP